MAQAGADGVGEGVGEGGGQANGAPAPQPMVRNAPAAGPGVGNAAPPAVALAAPPAPAMLAVAAIPNLPAPPVNAEPRFDVEGVLMGPLLRKSTTRLCEILPRVDKEEP